MRALAIAFSLVASPTLAQEVDHSQHGAVTAPATSEAKGGEPEIGNAPAPPVPSDHAADRFHPPERMVQAREALANESRFSTITVSVEQLEYRAVDGTDGYAWEAEAWYGGDIDRLVIATEGEGEFGHAPEQAELRAVWRHALDPWWNLELGIRHDFSPNPHRSYAVIGIEGLAPYWFEVGGRLFVSDKGEVHARAEASYDQRITQRMILQPRIELNAAFQDVPALRLGGGLESIELGARLRYQITPRSGTYIGVHWESKLGGTADLARAAGKKSSSVSAVFGIRAWF